jgi:transposase
MNVKKAAAKQGISHRTAHKRLERYKEGGEAAIDNRESSRGLNAASDGWPKRG